MCCFRLSISRTWKLIRIFVEIIFITQFGTLIFHLLGIRMCVPRSTVGLIVHVLTEHISVQSKNGGRGASKVLRGIHYPQIHRELRCSWDSTSNFRFTSHSIRQCVSLCLHTLQSQMDREEKAAVSFPTIIVYPVVYKSFALLIFKMIGCSRALS